MFSLAPETHLHGWKKFKGCHIETITELHFLLILKKTRIYSTLVYENVFKSLHCIFLSPFSCMSVVSVRAERRHYSEELLVIHWQWPRIYLIQVLLSFSPLSRGKEHYNSLKAKKYIPATHSVSKVMYQSYSDSNPASQVCIKLCSIVHPSFVFHDWFPYLYLNRNLLSITSKGISY